MTDPRVVITGLGVLAPIGHGRKAFWRSLAAARDGFRTMTDAHCPGLAHHYVAQLPQSWRAAIREALQGDTPRDPCSLIAVEAAREAWRNAGLDGSAPPRTALLLGTASGGICARSRYEHTPAEERMRRHQLLDISRSEQATAAVAEALAIDGPRITLSTACTSSTHALGHGSDLLRAGEAEVVLAGGVDVLAEELVAGFHAMGAIGEQPCAPFSRPIGMTLGEGAGFVVMERAEQARRRGATIWCALDGWSCSADGYHVTAPDPTGAGMARAIAGAIAQAGLEPNDIGYFDAHGTGTEANDSAEWRALQKVFGAYAERLPVSATKSFFGHALGAAGILEIAALLLAMRHHAILPTLHYRQPRAASPPAVVAAPHPKSSHYRHAVAHNAAFGGVNAAIVLTRIDEPKAKTHHHTSPKPKTTTTENTSIAILGWGTLLGTHATDATAALKDNTPLWRPLTPHQASPFLPAMAALLDPAAVRAALRGIDVRGMNRLARYLTATARQALAHAGLRIHRRNRGRIGLFFGANRLAWDSADTFWGACRTRGYDRAPAPAFARIVMNAPAGAVSRALSLHGPLSVVSEGAGSSLRALVLACQLLRQSRAVDVLVVGSAFELGRGMLEDMAFRAQHETLDPPGESSACVVLARHEYATRLGLPVRAVIEQTALSGPKRLPEALHRCMPAPDATLAAIYACGTGRASEALENEALNATLRAPHTAAPLHRPARIAGAGEALDALALAAACGALQPQERALVLAANARTGGSAVLLRAADPHESFE